MIRKHNYEYFIPISYEKQGGPNSCPKYWCFGFKNSNLLSALHLYLDEGSLHPIFCLIHLLHRIQPQPLLEMTTMMMMTKGWHPHPYTLPDVTIPKSKGCLAYNQFHLDDQQDNKLFKIHLFLMLCNQFL